MENFVLEQDNKNAINGSNNLPILIDVLIGKNGSGISFTFKIGPNYFFGNKKRETKDGTLNLRCKNYRIRNGSCGWSGKILNILTSDPKSDEYLKKENWILISNPSAQLQTCQEACVEEISTLQMMNFVKDKISDGITDFKSINQMTGIKEKYADYRAQLLGDHNRYQRIIQRTRKFSDGGAVPEEYTKMNKFNHETFSLISETCMHRKTYDYFYLPEFVPYLNNVISADGTFSCVKNISGVYQVYIISTQLYNDDRPNAYLQPLMLIFLPNKKTETYLKMWAEIKDFFFEITVEN